MIATSAAAKDPVLQLAGIAEKPDSPNIEPKQPLGPPSCDGSDYEQPGLHLGRQDDPLKDGWREAQKSCKNKPYSP